jgi:TonB family protein
MSESENPTSVDDTVVDLGTVDNGFGRREDDDGSTREDSIVMDLPEIEKDSAGIPTFVFQDQLSEDDRPTRDKKTLEVVLLWREAVMTVGHYSQPGPITIGDAKNADFRISADGIPVDNFHLLDGHGDGFAINWTDSMALEVRDASGDILGREELESGNKIRKASLDGANTYAYTIDLGDRVALQVGEVTFVIQYVSPARFIAGSLLKTIDLYFTKVLSLSFLGHAFLLLALILTPMMPSDMEDDLFKNPNRFAKLILKEPEKAPEPKKKFELSGSKGGGRHKDKEGKFGKPDKVKKDALASTKGAPKVDPNKREKDRKIALQSGIFKALSGGKGGAASNVFGPGGLGTGINNALGGLRGTAMGDAGGAGGLGTRGSGPGGGGNSLGIGGLGDGTGRGTGGLGNVDLGGRGKGRYKVIPGRTVTKGCLNQKQVMRVITRVQNQAKYCYERELTKNPNLSGKVITTFQINSTGSVSWVRIPSSTMGNTSVEKCLEKVVRRLRFPPCKGGGTAQITYPWIFKSGGG